MGTLYYGECLRTVTVLDILRRYLKDETVDLVYLDPPFNSAQNYNAFFHEKDTMLEVHGSFRYKSANIMKGFRERPEKMCRTPPTST